MIIMGVDLGQVRTGISVCDPREVLASPVKVITAHTPEKRLEEIHKAAGELRAGKIVVGLPRNMDGTEGASALSARETAARLQEITGLPVVLQDERGYHHDGPRVSEQHQRAGKEAPPDRGCRGGGDHSAGLSRFQPEERVTSGKIPSRKDIFS